MTRGVEELTREAGKILVPPPKNADQILVPPPKSPAGF